MLLIKPLNTKLDRVVSQTNQAIINAKQELVLLHEDMQNKFKNKDQEPIRVNPIVFTEEEAMEYLLS